nr:hypothetical protein [Histophilus somni]
MAKNWERLNNHLFPHLGAYSIENITPPPPFFLLINAVKPLYEQGKNGTMHRIINLVNQVLNYAVNLGVLSFNPCLQASKAYHKEPPKKSPCYSLF